MIDLSPPPLIGFEKPGIIRPNDLPVLAMPYMPGYRKPHAANPVLTYIGKASDIGNLSTYTFTAQPIGAANATRRVIVLAVARGTGATVSSITIGGVAASIAITPGGGGANPTGIASLSVASGTTANIVVTFTAGQSRCVIFVYTAIDLALGTVTDTAGTNVNTAATSASATLDFAAHGVGVVALLSVNNSADTHTWSGATKDDEIVVESQLMSSASFVTSTAVVNKVLSASWPTSAPGYGIAAASWS